MAYRNTITLQFNTNTDARFRTNGLAVAAELAAMGLVQTADSGQINWATVTKPGTGNTSAGYEIWRFDDAMQATNPVYIKFEYGMGSTLNCFGMWVQIGTGSDGAGTLTGPTSTRTAFGPSTTPTDGTYNCSFSGDTNRVAMCLFSNRIADVGPLMVGLERELDANGDLVPGGGVLIVYGNTSSIPCRQEYWSPSSGGLGVEGSLGVLAPLVGSGVDGFDLTLFPVFHAAGVFLPAGMNFFGYFSAGLTYGVPVTLTVYGETHTYYPLGSLAWNAGGKCTRSGPTGVSLLMRYDT